LVWYESNKKYFEFLNKRLKTKKIKGCKVKKHRDISKKLKFQEVHLHPLTYIEHRPWWDPRGWG
jgi:hypothetical protein